MKRSTKVALVCSVVVVVSVLHWLGSIQDIDQYALMRVHVISYGLLFVVVCAVTAGIYSWKDDDVPSWLEVLSVAIVGMAIAGAIYLPSMKIVPPLSYITKGNAIVEQKAAPGRRWEADLEGLEVHEYGERISIFNVATVPFPELGILGGNVEVAKVERSEEWSQFVLFKLSGKYNDDESVKGFMQDELQECLNTANQVYVENISPTLPLNLTIENHVRTCIEKKVVGTGLTIKGVHTYFSPHF